MVPLEIIDERSTMVMAALKMMESNLVLDLVKVMDSNLVKLMDPNLVCDLANI